MNTVISAPVEEFHHATCPQCTTQAQWRGEITAEMLARTFTRGLDALGLPLCPRCGTPMDYKVVAPEPISRAAELIAADAPRQPALPGIRPAFNHEAALAAILDQRAVVRRAEAIADAKHQTAVAAKKDAAEAQGHLSELEDEFAERLRELDAEAALPPEARGKCAFERLTGTVCPVCAEDPSIDAPTPDHLGTVARELAKSDELRAEDLALVLKTVAGLDVDRGVIEQWTPEVIREVATWLALPEKVGTPKVIRKLRAKKPNGSPEPVLDRSDADLIALLQRAGARVSPEGIARWSPYERLDAIRWAEDQVAANATAKPGTEVSVQWPEHVSAACRLPEDPPPPKPKRRKDRTR